MKLSQMVPGESYIRIIPNDKDWSYTSDVVIFDGISENGNMLIHYRDESFITKTLGNHPREIPYSAGWRPASILFDGVKSELSKYEGRFIKQIKPVLLDSDIKPIILESNIKPTPIKSRSIRFSFALTHPIKNASDESYMSTPVKLLSATQHHLVIEIDGLQKIKDSRYANASSWTLVE